MDRSNQSSALASIRTAVESFMGMAWDGPAPLAMGIGVVGHTEPSSGTWLHAMNIPIKSPVPLASQLSEIYGLPVAIDNDVHAAALAELHLGAGREATDLIYLNVGTGLAAGVICNGRLVRGAANYAGELGHMVVEAGGDLCQCGQRGCLEPIASGGGIIAQVKAQMGDHSDSALTALARTDTLTAGDVFQAADKGDELASSIAQRAVRGLGIALVNLVNLLNPQLIVYGGSVLSDGWLIEGVSNYVSLNALPIAYRSLRGIKPSPLHVERAGLLGAATLAWSTLTMRM